MTSVDVSKKSRPGIFDSLGEEINYAIALLDECNMKLGQCQEQGEPWLVETGERSVWRGPQIARHLRDVYGMAAAQPWHDARESLRAAILATQKAVNLMTSWMSG